tara:strand:- start:302 stop:472 length:171 start_codon:yes stop_codon:yes gene_type:complete
MAKVSTSGRLRLRRLKRINKTLLLRLSKTEKEELNDYLEYKAEESRYERLLNYFDY